MKHGYTGGKRQREEERDRKKRDKQDRLRRNREISSRSIASDIASKPEPLPEVKLEDVVLGVPKRPKRSSIGPIRLFVGGLSRDTTTDGLKTAFAKFGTLVDAAVISDRDTGRSRGFGFVTFEEPKDADTAIEQMSGGELDGRTLKVSRADPR